MSVFVLLTVLFHRQKVFCFYIASVYVMLTFAKLILFWVICNAGIMAVEPAT